MPALCIYVLKTPEKPYSSGITEIPALEPHQVEKTIDYTVQKFPVGASAKEVNKL